jgi:hypothetical protein
VQLTRRSSGAPLTRDGRVPPSLDVCRGCNEYIWPGEPACPHCGKDTKQTAEEHRREQEYREGLMAEVLRLVESARAGGAA